MTTTTIVLSLSDRRRFIGMAVPFAAVAGSLVIGLLLIAASGKSVPDAIEAFLDGAFGTAFAIGASINRAVALSLVGLGFILAFRANLTNVGGEGQIAVGGIVATAMGLWTPIANLPLGLAVILPLLGGTLAGALWGGVAGVMKVRFGTNEVISTLLLGFIALLLVYWCVQSTALLRQPQTSSATLPESLPIADAVKLPGLTGSPESPLHIGLVICLLLAGVTAVVLQRSTFGLRLRAIGLNELAARRAGMPGGILLVIALALAGAVGGLAGAIMLQGEQYYLKTGFSSGYGFDGLVVGLLSRGSTAGVLAGALFFGFLRSGGISMEIMAGVPAALTLVIQGLIVIAVAGSVILVERLERGGR
jgi:general nucleoside transport system permease protein